VRAHTRQFTAERQMQAAESCCFACRAAIWFSLGQTVGLLWFFFAPLGGIMAIYATEDGIRMMQVRLRQRHRPTLEEMVRKTTASLAHAQPFPLCY